MNNRPPAPNKLVFVFSSSSLSFLLPPSLVADTGEDQVLESKIGDGGRSNVCEGTQMVVLQLGPASL